MDRKNSRPTGQTCVAEAHRLANLLIADEKREGLDTANAIERAESRWLFDRHVLHRLRYKARELEDVKASTLEGLRWAYEAMYERQRRLAAADLNKRQDDYDPSI